MKRYIIISLILSINLIAKNFIVQKPIIFLTTPQASKYEQPISVEDLIQINSSNKKTLDSLKSTDRNKLKSYALKFNKRKGITATKKFRNDCSGFVRKVFYQFDIELFKLPRNELRKLDGTWVNGSELIWKYCKKHGEVFIRKTPKIGDIVFFDNTHDRNKNGRYDDYFTHVAIVVKVEKDGTVHYIHKANSGIKISKLNAKHQNTYKKGKKVVNDFLRKKGKNRLSAQLVRGYGSIYKKSHRSMATVQTKKKDKDVKVYRNTPKVDTKKKVAKKKPPVEKHGHASQKNTKKNVVKKKVAAKKKDIKKSHSNNSTPLSNHTVAVQLISSKHRKQIVKKAVSLIGKKIRKQDFVKKVYSSVGFGVIDNEFNDEKFTEKKIFWTVKKHGRLFTLISPKVGDLIFFDKINGKKHYLNIGIIEDIQHDRIKFIYSSNGVVKRSYINNKLWKSHKNKNRIINSYLTTDKNSHRKLTSEFFRRFGSLFVR